MTTFSESKLESTRLQKESSEAKSKAKLELEKIRHQNIMEELEFMAKHKITFLQRGNIDKAGYEKALMKEREKGKLTKADKKILKGIEDVKILG